MKRAAGDNPERSHSQSQKKHKHEHSERAHDDSRPNDGRWQRSGCNPHHDKHRSDGQPHHLRPNNTPKNDLSNPQKQPISHEDALSQLPPPTSQSGPVTAYLPFTIPHKNLPPLPDVKPGPLTTSPFRHKSTTAYNRTSSSSDMTYERLEFLGDAYIELIASRLIFERYGTLLPVGQQSQLRELLVKNETLAEYSRAYGFDTRIEIQTLEKIVEEGKLKGNKGFNKVLGDVFEAYLAAVILSDVEDGFAIAEKWLTALWAPKLLDAMKNDRYNAPAPIHSSPTDADPLKTYNPAAKADLQKRILGPPGVKLLYETYKDSIELKGDQIGQNRHFIALYLSGHGYERKLLGKGEGKNKVEAGNWAATEAMYGECKGLVEEIGRKNEAKRTEVRKEREAKGGEEKGGE